MTRRRPARPPPLAALAVCVALAGTGLSFADAPRLPWADPIGGSPALGTARPRLPYAEPIGMPRPDRPRHAVRTLPRPVVTQPSPRHRPTPRPACYRFRDNRGHVGIRCRRVR